ncbi:hypothetical protein [Planomonospora parontospora]|uniref:hypothetical protein n=1 Tax=Planomonospora parontospora TaxID=58119 RepID=UPI00167122BF|nr:hypothetical protein [Planomonospora parontospora]GGL21909.1 hypothetical protein GCM10014719_24910 [Planomonospora parontospora subsp. antibiotica]GII15732.1 hypothetical protein Ppa05_24580 [Planomonospora parontospora subsp. antibiotica]
MKLLRVRGGELTAVGSWVYVWVRAGSRQESVIYVGGTGLPPAVRIWLHLHDSDPEIGRLAARYSELAREDLDVLAFAVPGHLARRLVKDAVVQSLHRQGMLAEQYVGDPPAVQPIAEDVVEVAERIVTAVVGYGRAAGEGSPR